MIPINAVASMTFGKRKNRSGPRSEFSFNLFSWLMSEIVFEGPGVSSLSSYSSVIFVFLDSTDDGLLVSGNMKRILNQIKNANIDKNQNILFQPNS